MGNKQVENKEEKKKEKIIYSNGEYYEGEIVDKIRHGYGIHHYKNGDRYDGMWFNNMKHGTGILFYKNGDFYDGWWQNDNREGVGTYFYNNGDRYYGEWKDNNKQGKGFIYCDDGSKFIGEFKNNKKNGKGEFICKTGANYYQDWKDGVLIKQVEKYKADKMDYIDYRDLNSNSFEKYLDNKNNQNFEIKSMKSKYLSLEFAKYLKSKHPEGFYDSMRIVKNNNLLLEKPDINLWSCQDVYVWLNQIGFTKNIEKVIEKRIDGKMLLKMDSLNFSSILGICEEKQIILLSKSMDLLKKLHNQNDYLKSITKSNYKGNKDNLKSNDLLKMKKIIPSRMIEESENKIEFYEEVGKKKEDNNNNNITLKQMILDKPTKEEDQKIEDGNEANNKFDRMNELEQTHALNIRTMTLNGLNFFINYDEFTLTKQKVGEGGFGEVFLGTWNGKHIAVKKLTLKQTTKDRSVFLRFINEINIISSLRHPNIVLYMGASIENHNYYMITEYLPKGSLFDYIHRSKGKFSEYEQIHIAYEIAVALKYLHSRNIIHCDLKSSNILIDDNWKIKIGDFGLSRFINKKNPSENSGRIGTPHWMAPEILKGGNYEESADVYSYGMILWEILSLEIPYFGIDPRKLMNIVAEERKIVEIPKKGNAHIIHLTIQCLNYDPHKRPNLKEIVDTLENVLNQNKFNNVCMEEIHDYFY